MINTLSAQQYDDLRKLASLTSDEGDIDSDKLDAATIKRLFEMDGLVERYDSEPYLMLKAYRLMIEYLEQK